MQATDKESETNQLLAGLHGFNKEKGLFIVHKCFFYQFLSLEHAQKNTSLFYNHHGSYEDVQLQE